MALKNFVEWHRANLADLTVAVKAVPRSEAHAFGVMKIDSQGRIIDFVEKPQDEAQIDELVVPPQSLERLGFEPGPDQCLASMGIYVFKPAVLKALLDGTSATDFGHEVIPTAVPDLRVFAFGYSGYWRDIGTIPAFHHANLELTQSVPPLDLYSPTTPFYTHPRFLPGTKIDDCSVHHSVICEGSVVSGASVSNSIVGIRSMIREGTVIDSTVMMGANFYEWESDTPDTPLVGIGRNCTIRNAIIDLDSSIGDGVQLINEAGRDEVIEEDFAIRGGVIVIPRGSSIPNGTVI
jgi:glucose-1-phosphate adenylyltransferase